MSVAELERYLNDLLTKGEKIDEKAAAFFEKAAKGWFGVSEREWLFLHNNVLGEHRHNFANEKARRKLKQFLAQVKFTPTLKDWFFQHLRVITLFFESFWGQWLQIFKDGTAPPDIIRRVREEASQKNFRGTVSLARLHPVQAEVGDIRKALKKTIQAIDGFDFLKDPPQGKTANEHTILIKVGVNWGYFGYPTATSWESVYTVTAMCFEEAAKRGAKVEVKVGDESGIENVLWNHSTTRNLAHTKILHGAVLAGLERAAALEEQGPGPFDGARQLLAMVKDGYWIPPREPEFLENPMSDQDSAKMIRMAENAGVSVMAFDEVHQQERLSVPGYKVKYFTEGILVPRFVAQEVTDIINLPKPPGRHLIMGNTGLTGALKNHVGLMAGSERATDPLTKGTEGLHGLCDRYPKFRRGTPESYLANLEARHRDLKGNAGRRAARRLAWDVISTNPKLTPDWSFHEKIVEIYLAFAAKERFSATDMRCTISSLGPDWGDTMDIGAVIAAKDPLTLDVFAGALLKRAYEQGEKDARGRRLGFLWGLLYALKPGGDTFLEYLIGKTWLRTGTTPFDLMSHIAANSYLVGPVDLDHIDLKGFEDSGYSCEEMLEIIRYMTPA
jgi:hypothetical protein